MTGDGAGSVRAGLDDRRSDAIRRRSLTVELVANGQFGPEQPAPALAYVPAPQVEIVIPVRNEEGALAPSIQRLTAYVRTEFPFRSRITIADNGSSDGTWAVAEELAEELPEVRAVQLAEPGRGRALRACWLVSDAEVVAYMDVDLSSGLEALLPLVAPLMSGHSDLAIGTRLARGARVCRGSRREVISRCYNLLLHTVLDVGFSDAQCGFKAIRADKARELLPLTEDSAWFFDTELLVLAEQAGLRIHEVPVDWIDDPDSSVDVVATALADLRGIARLSWRMARGTLTVPSRGGDSQGLPAVRWPARQLLRFAEIGLASGIAYILLYLVLRTVLNAQIANAATLLAVSIASTAANRRITFGIRGRLNAARHQIRGLIAFGAGLLVTSAGLAVLHAAVHRPARALEVAVLLAASCLATLVRFVLYRSWVFRPRQAPPRPLFAAGESTESAVFAGIPEETEAAAMGSNPTPAAQPELSAPRDHRTLARAQ